MDKKELAVLEKLGYRTLSKLGYGGYGIVFLVEKNGKERVVKIAKGKFSKEINLSEIREAIFLKQLQSPYIVGIGEVSVSQDDSYIVIELERMDMAFSEIEKIKQTVDYYKRLIYSVVKALNHMHTRGFVHNDIKPQNILISKDRFKLADFGLCNYMGLPIPNGLVSFCSTDYYKAPNSVGDKIYVPNNRYNYNSDMYSLGALMYWMVVKIPEKKKQAAAIDLTAEEYLSNRQLFIDYYGAEGVDFMERCLDRSTATRMNSKTALDHPYLKKKTAGGSTFTKFVKEKYSEDDMYAVEYIEDYYKNYKDFGLQFHKIKNNAEYLAEIEKMLQFTLTYNKSMESFVQYMILFRKTIRDFPQKKIDDLSLCCFSMMSKVYEDTACNVMLKRLLREIPNKTPEDTLVKLELEILNHYGFNVHLVPIHSMIYYYFLKNKKIDINVSFQSAIRLLLSTRIDSECTLDELVRFAIKPIKGNKLDTLKKDGMTNNIGLIDAIDLEPEDDEEEEEPEVEVDEEPEEEEDEEEEEEEDDGLEVEICEIDGKKYLKDESGTIYDAQTQEMLGKYDFQKKKWIGSNSSNVKSTQSTKSNSSNLEVEECVIDGITYFKDEEGNVYNSETEELVGKFNFSKTVWINYKESMNSIYENAMSLYTQGDRVNMVRYLQHHIELFSDKKYLNLRRVILEKAQEI
jgi:serine/threonine protein kinase